MLDQLAEGGRLVIPVGPPNRQRLFRVQKQSKVLRTESLVYCELVPLLGEAGWRECDLDSVDAYLS